MWTQIDTHTTHIYYIFVVSGEGVHVHVLPISAHISYLLCLVSEYINMYIYIHVSYRSLHIFAVFGERVHKHVYIYIYILPISAHICCVWWASTRIGGWAACWAGCRTGPRWARLCRGTECRSGSAGGPGVPPQGRQVGYGYCGWQTEWHIARLTVHVHVCSATLIHNLM